MANSAILYTHPDCTYSYALKADLDEAGTTYKEIDLSLDPAKWNEVERLANGERITPVLVVGNTVTIGFNGIG